MQSSGSTPQGCLVSHENASWRCTLALVQTHQRAGTPAVQQGSSHSWPASGWLRAVPAVPAVPGDLTPITHGALCSGGQYDRPTGQKRCQSRNADGRPGHAWNQASTLGQHASKRRPQGRLGPRRWSQPSTWIKHLGAARAHCSSRGTGRSAARRPRKFARLTGPTQLSLAAARWVQR